MSYVLVDDAASLEGALADLSGAEQLYVDTEFESNKSGQRLCLLQVSAGRTIYLVDAIKLPRLDALAKVFQSPGVEWILHAGLQDVQLIVEQLRLAPPARLFDTQIAWALVSAENSVSLAYLQFKLLGVRSSKAHQADDWIKRPFSPSQLRYAASDVEHLPRLVERLTALAGQEGRLDLVRQASREALNPIREATPPLRLEAFRNAWQLEARSQAGLTFLIDWYNQLPNDEKRDAPDVKTLLAIASRLPEDIDALGRIKGVARGVVSRHGRRLVTGLASAANNANVEAFTPIDPPPYATFAETRLDAWLGTMRAEVCASLEVSPEFVLPARVLRDLKVDLQRHGAAGISAALSGFRLTLLGPSLTAFCEQHPPPL